MRIFTIVLSIAPMLLTGQPSTAQQPGNYLERGEVQRAGGAVTIVSNYPRPLEQVLDTVSQEYGWAINYEDPPYHSSFDLIDATDPKWKAAHPDSAGVRNVRGGLFRITYPENAATPTSAKDQAIVIKKIVTEYNASGNPGQFVVRERSGDRLDVIGTAVRTESGKQQGIAPILDTTITVQSASMNAYEAVGAIVAAVSAKTGIRVEGTRPYNLLLQTKVKLDATEMPARDVLQGVLSQARIKLYWRLLYDDDSSAYYFNVETARRVQYDTFGQRHFVLMDNH